MKFNLFFAGMVVLFFSTMNAQNSEPGNVTVDQLLEKFHPLDSTANAAILTKKGRTFFKYNIKDGFVLNHEYFFRIKVYKKEGLSWANFQVSYYVGYEDLHDESVRFSNACTYNLENGKIVNTKLNSEGSFKKNVNSYWSIASISLPNVKVGSVIEFKYTIKSENIVKFPVYENQYSIPLNYSEYNTEVPEFFIYKTLQIGTTKIDSDSKLDSGSQSFDNVYGQRSNMKYKQINSTYLTKNIPAIKDEDYVDNIKNYTSAIQNELERTRYPDEPVKEYTVTWEGVSRNIFENKSFGPELNERQYVLQDVQRIIANVVGEEEKLAIIFKFVQSKMNWNNENGYFTDKGVKKAYLDQTGNVAEINFILIAMMKLAGLNANPVLISTVDNGIPIFPNRIVFNYIIASAEIDGKYILLDATNKYTSQNVLPLKALNRIGRLIREDGSSQEISLDPTTVSKLNYSVVSTITDTGTITGKIIVQRSMHEAFRFREQYANSNKDNYVEFLENNLGSIQIKDYTIENKVGDLSKPVTEIFSFSADNHCEKIAGKIYVDPLLFFTTDKNPFKQEKRQMPLFFGYPLQEKYIVNIEVPEGYEVESLPKPVKIVLDDNIVVFSINALAQQNKIQLIVTKELNTVLLAEDFYEDLKNFYQRTIEIQKQKIVLKKI